MNKRQLFLNLWQHPEFLSAFQSEWKAARLGPLSNEKLSHMVESRSEYIRRAAERDQAIWKRTNRTAFWTPCWPDDAHNFASSVNHLAQYLVDRATWIDLNIDTLVRNADTLAQKKSSEKE